MVINFAFAAGMAMLSLIDPATPGSRSGLGIQRATAVVAVVDPFNPPPPKPKRRRPRPPPSQTGAPADKGAPDEFEEEPPPPPPRRAAPPPRRRPIPVEETDQEGAAAQEDDEEGERPKVKRKLRRQVVEEEEEEEEEGGTNAEMESLPVILPRLISLQAGPSTMGRSFGYNAPLQRETTFPRPGLTVALESFPLLRMPQGWWTTIGVGFNLAMEFGAAALQQAGGATLSFPVSQRRWSVDARYAIPAGAHFLVVPAVGYGSLSFDLKRPTTQPSLPPSECNNTQMAPCLADVKASHLVADVGLRVAVTSSFGMSLTAGYFVGLGVGRGAGQIGSERPATTLGGFHADLGGRLIVTDWMAVFAALPFTRYSYSFNSGGAGAYSSATETYYGFTGGAAIFLP